MDRYLSLWRLNPSAPWPRDPIECPKIYQRMLESLEGCIEKGEIEDCGFFRNGIFGYLIGTREAIRTFRQTRSYQPFIFTKVHKTIPYDQGKEASSAVMRIRAKEEA